MFEVILKQGGYGIDIPQSQRSHQCRLLDPEALKATMHYLSSTKQQTKLATN